MVDRYIKLKNAGTNRRFLFLKSSSGFTLIELIATMVIMAILASSTITNYSKFNMGLRIFEEVKDMSRKIIYARDYCTVRKEIFYLKVDKDADQYSLFRQNSSTALVLPDESSHQFDLPSFVDISATSIVAGGLAFDAVMGEPQGITANATIAIGDFTITIENPTGYIHVQ